MAGSDHPPRAARWVDTTLAHLTLEERVGQMLQIRVYGDYASFAAPDYLRVRDEIVNYHIGSVDLGARMSGPNLVKGAPAQVAAVLNQLQRDSALPLLVGADIERGLASRLADAPEFPFPMAFAAAAGPTPDPAMVQRFAAISAAEARAVGIHWAYAPVADVNSNAANPIINTRAYGEDPAAVAALVAAYVRGAHRNHMLVAVKHFPGEGDTASDPHVHTTRIDADKDHLARVEYPPFVSAIAAGADAVMLAQVAVPALDPDPARIATTSGKIVDGVLRGQLGFTGVTITDALEMRGLTALYPGEANPSGRIAVDAVKAGNDVLMIPRDLDAAFTAIVAAVRAGEIPESRIDASVRRILTMKAELGLNEQRFVDLDALKAAFAGTETTDFAQQVSDASITLVRSNGKVLPLRPGNPAAAPAKAAGGKLVVVIFADSSYSRLGPAFEREMKARRPDAVVFHAYNDGLGSDADPAAVLPAIDAADQVVLAAFLTHTPGRQLAVHGAAASVVGLSGDGAQFFADALERGLDKTVVVALGSPYLIESYPDARNYVCTYSLTPTAEVSAAKALFGEIDNHSRLPVTLPGVAARGFAIPWQKAAPAKP